MRKEAIGTGVTVDLALEAACREIGLDREDVEFEILEMPVKKTLGLFGGSLAKVLVFKEETPVNIALDYLKNIFDSMGMEGIKIDVEEKSDSAVFTLSGEGLGFLIGRRGETLDAIQYLTGLVANRVRNDSYFRITINSGNYREKREQTLTSLARRIAIAAVKTGRNNSLEPMNPYERRIIHTAVQSVRGASSWSVGSEPNRCVVIGVARDGNRSEGGRSAQRDGGYQFRPNTNPPRKSGDNRNPARQDRPAKEFAAATAQPKQTPQSSVRESTSETPLYGKIEPRNKD